MFDLDQCDSVARADYFFFVGVFVPQPCPPPGTWSGLLEVRGSSTRDSSRPGP